MSASSTPHDPVRPTRRIVTGSASTDRDGQAKLPFVHRTQSVGCGDVLEGEMVLLPDNEEVLMRQSDFAVKRGANHAWANRSGQTHGPTVQAGVCVDRRCL